MCNCTNCGDSVNCFGGVVIGGGTVGPAGPQGPAGPAGADGADGSTFVPARALYYYQSLNLQRPFTGNALDAPAGLWMENNVEFHVTDLDLDFLDNGTYFVNSNFIFLCGETPVTPNFILNYELRLNGIQVPLSTRNTFKHGGTHQDTTFTEGTVGQVVITAPTDTIQLWVYITVTSGDLDPMSQVIKMQSGTLVAHRLTAQ